MRRLLLVHCPNLDRLGSRDRSVCGDVTLAEIVQALRSGDWSVDGRSWTSSRTFAGKPATFRGYANALRLIASEILATQKDKKRFAPTHAESYRRKIDSFPLAILTPESIQAWRISRVSKSITPARQRSARISCNSTLRAAKALFGRKTLKFTSAPIPDPIPFAGVEFYPRESMRYHSKIDAAELLRAASTELAGSDLDAFKALILASARG